MNWGIKSSCTKQGRKSTCITWIKVSFTVADSTIPLFSFSRNALTSKVKMVRASQGNNRISFILWKRKMMNIREATDTKQPFKHIYRIEGCNDGKKKKVNSLNDSERKRKTDWIIPLIKQTHVLFFMKRSDFDNLEIIQSCCNSSIAI